MKENMKVTLISTVCIISFFLIEYFGDLMNQDFSFFSFSILVGCLIYVGMYIYINIRKFQEERKNRNKEIIKQGELSDIYY